MTQAEVLTDVARVLNGLGISWCLVGSYATSAHGQPRTTHDIDIQLVLTVSNVHALVAALGDEYYADAEGIRASFSQGLPHNLIHQETQDKVDLWPVKPDRYDREAFGRRLAFEHLGQTAYVQTAEDAILSKLRWMAAGATGRHYGDALGVALVQGDALDFDYLRRWAGHLGVQDQLVQLLDEAQGELRDA